MFHRLLSKKYLFFELIIVIICFFIFWQYTSKSEEVYMRIITSEDGPELSELMIAWITHEKASVGIHAYEREDNGFYELLLLDNRQQIDNLYLHTEVESRIENDVLTIVSDSDIQYNEKLYFILKEKPREIKIITNGNPDTLSVQSGGFQITK